MNFSFPLFHPKYFPLLRHKYLEFEVGKFRHDTSYFDFIVRWTKNIDHAGLKVHLEFFSYFLAVDIYDNRHWNYKEECWEDCDTEEMQ